MLKVEFLIAVLVIATAACGPRTRNQVPAAPDNDSEVEENIKVVSAIDPADMKDFSILTGPGCESSSGAKAKVIDNRVTVDSTFTEEEHQKNNGIKTLYTYLFTVTAVTNTEITLNYVTTFNKAKAKSEELKCQVSDKTFPRLACKITGQGSADAFLNPIPKGMLKPMLNGDCQVAHGVKPDSIKGENVLYALKKDSTPNLKAQKVTTTYKGALMCGGKALGQGTEQEVKIYSADVPSIDQTACGAALLKNFHEFRDSKNTVKARQLNKVTDVSLVSKQE